MATTSTEPVDDRADPPPRAGEMATSRGFLAFLRGTVARKAAGLDRHEMLTTHPPSSLTLLGLLKHLAFVEDYWCGQVLAGRDPEPPWDTAPWDDDPDWDWHSAADDDPDQVLELWRATVRRSDAVLDGLTPEDLSVRERGSLGHVSVRWVLLHLVEEYARHAGHADLVRESLDGSVGE